jgi:hypothetical protein
MPSIEEKDQAAREAAAKAMGVPVKDVLIVKGIPEYRPSSFVQQATLRILQEEFAHENQG